MPPEKSTRRLGRGLDALFNTPAAAPPAGLPVATALRDIPVSDIKSNPFQPRKTFKQEELAELQESLKSNGLLQPVTVRESPAGKGFELIAGERRLRAATALGWKTIPAVVKEFTDQEILTLALVENLQRSDLNPIEEAEGYEKLIKEFGHTQQSVATMVGKDRSTVANVLRILQLPQTVRKQVEEGKLTAGQARPLLALESESKIISFARNAIDNGWSAREIESRVREATAAVSTGIPSTRGGRPPKSDTRPAELKSLEQRLRKHLQTDVTISLKDDKRGSIIIEFYSPDDLDRVSEILGLTTNPQ
ncbi:MAG TPA: ParB/RepB/Spo0J family partition protein [Gemmatimonadaceae bacterium]|nr:ParB/RepB/Spo0J family partition protein [Gemmatimonadaceae bacterium]